MAYLLCSLLNSSSISLGAVVSFDMAITSMLLQSLSVLCDAYCLWCLHTGELCFERKKKAWIYLEIRILRKRRGRRRKEGGGGRGEGKYNSKLDKRGCEIILGSVLDHWISDKTLALVAVDTGFHCFCISEQRVDVVQE